MKLSFLIIMLSLSFMFVKAQDQIITTQNDTIECKIISINGGKIYYEQKADNKQIVGKSVATTDVHEYYRAENTSDKNKYTTTRKRQKPEFPLSFSLQSGFNYSLTNYSNLKDIFRSQGSSSSDMDDFIKKLKNGYFFGANVHYMLTEYIGIGFDYNLSYSSADDEFFVQSYNGMNIAAYSSLKLDNKLISNFIAPSFIARQAIGNQQHIYLSGVISPGMLFFREESRTNSYQIFWGDNNYYTGDTPLYYENANSVSTGNTFSVKGSFAIEYAITPQFSGGLVANFTYAKINEISLKNADYEYEDQELEKKLDVSRIDYGFIFRYNF